MNVLSLNAGINKQKILKISRENEAQLNVSMRLP